MLWDERVDWRWLVGFGFGFGGGVVGSYICLTRSVTRIDMCASFREREESTTGVYMPNE